MSEAQSGRDSVSVAWPLSDAKEEVLEMEYRMRTLLEAFIHKRTTFSAYTPQPPTHYTPLSSGHETYPFPSPSLIAGPF